jgi:putative ABC transport system permease protein
MFRPRWRKVIHDLTDSKLRTLLVVVSIAVGVFAVGVIAGAYEIIAHDMSASYAATNPLNLELRASDFDQEMVTAVGDMRGVKEAEGRRVFNLRVRRPGATDWTPLTFVAIDDYAGQRINQLTPLGGAARPAKNQIVLEREARTELGAPLGVGLELEMADGTVKTLPVVGFVQDQATGADDFLAAPLAFIHTDTLVALRQPERFNRMFVTLAEGGNDPGRLREMVAAVKDKMEKVGLTIVRTDTAKSSEHPMASTVQAVLGILGALGVLILLLSSSLIANTLTALLNQHLRYIGVMKLVGARRYQIVSLYLALILAFGLIALAVAIPLGGQGAYALADFIADQMNFNVLGYRVVPLALGIQIVVGLAIPLLAGLVPVLNGSRISVQRALSGDLAREEKHPAAAHGGRPRSLAGRLALRGIHLPRPLLISLRNTFRRRGRLVLTLFTLTMGGAIFVAVFDVRLTLHDYVGQIGRYFVADVTLDFDRPYRLAQVEQAARQIPGVTHVEGWAFANAEALNPDGSPGENLTILAPPAESRLVEPMLVAGRWLRPGDEKAIAISEGILATFPDLGVGQTLRLKIDGQEADWRVVGLFKFVNQQGVIGYATYEYISRLTHLANRSVSFRLVAENHDPASQRALSETVDRFFRDRGFHVRETNTGRSTLSTASESLDILVTFLLIMALLTASVGSMGLAGTMGMNVLERTREIGIMRSVGAVDREIMRTVIVEGVTIGGLSWVLGALLSFPFTYLLATIVSLAIFQSPIEVKFTPEGFVIWLGVVLGLSALASALPARNAARLTIREVLAYE